MSSDHQSHIINHKSRVILVGYRGTGKTTVGGLLAARLGWEFADADDLVETTAGKSVAAIFADEGEAGFRDRETAARRPNLTPAGGIDEARALLAAREPLYRELAHFTVATDAPSPGEVADAILTAWNGSCSSRS